MEKVYHPDYEHHCQISKIMNGLGAIRIGELTHVLQPLQVDPALNYLHIFLLYMIQIMYTPLFFNMPIQITSLDNGTIVLTDRCHIYP